ncbi:hypothetical protein DAPPUDRAFT_239108 [Daphnia pulex]|uniref:Uncharacterized protein n=1 Tax=Daphnia pulex TaxID=6669 RepID=E9G8D0_DAPPU|nr:hypothetical protein DAPPUDRAFT_239108 [Daphnia pulex]|eukprot:EFX83955.1 hypothetical protein DAPPUDRAFT_239108 [Daphnia pulex]
MPYNNSIVLVEENDAYAQVFLRTSGLVLIQQHKSNPHDIRISCDSFLVPIPVFEFPGAKNLELSAFHSVERTKNLYRQRIN